MNAFMSRRNFAFAASSLGAAMMAGPLNFLAKLGGGSSGVFPSAGDAAAQSQDNGVRTKPKVLVFDVNQTMLDLNALRPQFARVFGDAKARQEGFCFSFTYPLW